jgi:hypothetical protein
VEENNMTFNVTGNVTSHKNITDLYPWTTYMFCSSGTEITELSAKIYYKLIIVPNIRTIVR